MKTLTFLAILLATGPPLFAAPGKAADTVSVRGLVFEPGFPGELHAHDASGTATAGTIQIKSYLNHESNELTLKGRQLVFTEKSSPASATDVHQVCGQVELPADVKSAILLFLPESNDAETHKCQVMPIDDSAKAFPAGSFKVANYSEFPVKIELNATTVEIAPGESKIIDKIKFSDSQSASMHAYRKNGDEWVTISTGSWANPGNKRVLQVVYKDLTTKGVQLKGVRDVVVP